MAVSFDPNCTRCDRLAKHLSEIRIRYPKYHARPVPSFGAAPSQFLIVGLAPGMHGANATGRPFTGDHAGLLLYASLYEAGFASHPDAVAAGEALVLKNCRITNAVRCLPPANKPQGIEVTRCNSYLAQELDQVSRPGLILALGTIAHRAVLKRYIGNYLLFRFGTVANTMCWTDCGCSVPTIAAAITLRLGG